MGEAKVLRISSVESSENTAGVSQWVKLPCGGEVEVFPMRERQCLQKHDKDIERVRRNNSVPRKGELSSLQGAEALARAYFGTYVGGWRAIELTDGNPVPFTEDYFVQLCIGDPNREDSVGIPGFWDAITAFIARRKDEHAERVKSNLGNS